MLRKVGKAPTYGYHYGCCQWPLTRAPRLFRNSRHVVWATISVRGCNPESAPSVLNGLLITLVSSLSFFFSAFAFTVRVRAYSRTFQTCISFSPSLVCEYGLTLIANPICCFRGILQRPDLVGESTGSYGSYTMNEGTKTLQ